MGTSARAQMMRIRLADLWGDVWRWMLMAAGTVLGAYFLLDRGVQNGVLTATVLGVLVIGDGPVVLEADGDRVDGDARALHLGASRPRRQRPVGFGRRARGGVRNRSAPRTPSLQPPLAGDADAQPRVSVRHAVHGHRQPLSQRTRSSGSMRGCSISGALVVGWAVARAGYARLALNLMVGAALRDRGRHARHGSAAVRRRQLRRGLPGVAVPDAQELRRHGDGLHGDHRLRESRLGRLDRGTSRAPAFWLLVIAIVMTQSRQALIGSSSRSSSSSFAGQSTGGRAARCCSSSRRSG